MNRISFIAALVLVNITVSCELNEKQSPETADLVVGTWIDPVYTDSSLSYKRSSSLIENQYGLSIHAAHTVLERKNSGWCGTPPISYADFDGTWNRTDSIMDVSVDFWGGTAEYTWKVLKVDENELIVEVIEMAYPMPR